MQHFAQSKRAFPLDGGIARRALAAARAAAIAGMLGSFGCGGAHATEVDQDAIAPDAMGTTVPEAMSTADAALDAVDGATSAGDAMACTSGPERDGPYTRLMVVGETSAQGIIDPSVEYASNADTGFMSYTAVPSVANVHIAIASSNDGGATWQYVSDVSTPRAITLETTDDSVCGSSSCAGTLVQESSSLVLDSTDPDTERRLKVFAHTYFFGNERQLQLGYLTLFTAGSAAGPWAETPLFGWPSSSPISNSTVAHDISVDPALSQLRDCLIVAEPGALVRPSGTIDLALSCVSAHADGSSTIDIRLVRSVDHGATWTYVGTLLGPDDARVLGAASNKVNGGDLFYANGAYHLIATPLGLVDFPAGRAEGYRGCVVVSIADLDAGLVARCDGAPVVEARYLGKPGQFVGACSTDEGATAAGMLIPVPDLTASQPFQMFASGLSIP